MGYPFWLKNQASSASSDAWQARRQAENAKIEKENYQKNAIHFVKEIEMLLDSFSKDGNPEELILKLKESIKNFKEEK